MKLDFKKFLNENGLKVGDKIKLSTGNVCEICQRENGIYLVEETLIDTVYSISNLQYDFDKVELKKKVGDLICKNVECDKCPLYCIRCLCNYNNVNDTIREIFEATLKTYPELEPIRAYFEQKLDKEVE